MTFLFTDIEGSTRRWQDDPEEMRALPATQDEVLRRLIGKHHGHVFKYTGDGIAAAFASASDALAVVVDVQEQLRDVVTCFLSDRFHRREARPYRFDIV